MISYETVLEIITSFYEVAKKDILIGYHFRVIEDFDEHIPRIADFWNLQLNGQLKHKEHLPFDLLSTHKKLKVNLGEIHRWVKLFDDNLDDFYQRSILDEKQIREWKSKVNIFRDKLIAFL